MNDVFHHGAAEAIMRAVIRRVDPVQMMTDCLSLEGETLQITTEHQSLTFDLSRYHRILVLGAGKAGASMARGLETVLGDWISEGLVAVKYGHTGETGALRSIRLIEAGHPVPDENSLYAAHEMARLAGDADESTLCFALISGGGSSLVTLPASDEVTLEDIQTTTHLLLGAGTPIGKINCVRKHLSGISGGRFARMVAPATLVGLILSDVVGDELGSIASGLAAPDPTTYEDALRICRHYGITDYLPRAARALLEAGERGDVPETPKPGDPVFETVHPLLIGTNALALEAARQRAEASGYNTLVLTSRLTGEAREIARLFTGIAADLVARDVPLQRPACVLAGGETTVTLRGSGTGGRNQEMALGVLAEIADRPESYRGVTFLSFGTDGNDGPTDAAGGWASADLAQSADRTAIDAALKENDSYHLLESIGALVRTGPTNTNVCDIQVLLVE